MTLVEFLRARLDEDEQAARRTLQTANPHLGEWAFVTDSGMQVRDDRGHLIVKHTWPNEGEHIARHDPARVLTEVEAKRRIVDECAYWYDKVQAGEDYPALADRFEVAMTVLRLLALPHAGHPDYDESWRP